MSFQLMRRFEIRNVPVVTSVGDGLGSSMRAQPMVEHAWLFSSLDSALDGQPPGIAADRDRFYHGQAVDIDHRDIIADAVAGEQLFLVGRQGQMPDAPPD